MYDIEKIKNYILFLKKQCGLFITLHPIKKEPLIFSSGLIDFNIHDNPYCIYLKSFPNIHRHCMDRQHKILEKCKGGSFGGCCFAGCFEYVYPISNGKEILGFISVGGYKNDASYSYLKATAEKYLIPLENLQEAYNSLKSPPDKAKIDILLLPLCDMLELAYIKSDNDGDNNESFIDSVLRYIKQYHTCDITLEDVCKHFSCNRFYISHRFKKATGMTFREYLTVIRIEDAKSLLKYSKLTITEISFAVGFSDSNYFSNVFKKLVGISPSSYRKNIT